MYTRIAFLGTGLVTWFNPGTAASPAAFHGRRSKRLHDRVNGKRARPPDSDTSARATRQSESDNSCTVRTADGPFLIFSTGSTPAQVEGTPIPIVPGRVSKIPPIYERPTTSNISIEEGGVPNVSKSCNRQQLPSSVTRGVRSRPLGDATSTKVDTVPLLSPTMETELLKEPWVFPRTKASPTKEEDTAVLSPWEEDFQDLSSWCMDTFQGQCDFHIGESTTFKLSGTKYEGNGVSIAEEEELLKDLTRTTDDEKLDLKMDTVKTTKESSDNRHLLLPPSELVNEYGLGHNNEDKNASWLMSPESTTSKSTSSSKQHNTDTSAPFQSESHDLDYAGPLNTVTNQREMWDELRTIETTGSDTFDLLSYLWEDEMRSLEGKSSGSTNSSAMLKVRPQTTSSPVLSFTPTKVKTEEEINEPTPPLTRRRMETRATSTITSSTPKSPAPSSRRSERTRLAATKSKEKERVAVNSTKTKNGRKRYYESDDDSEDDVALIQYRECREKNNEASRRSRMNKKAKESEMSKRATELERDNKILKMKVEELEKLVTSMRNALLRSALKKDF